MQRSVKMACRRLADMRARGLFAVINAPLEIGYTQTGGSDTSVSVSQPGKLTLLLSDALRPTAYALGLGFRDSLSRNLPSLKKRPASALSRCQKKPADVVRGGSASPARKLADRGLGGGG